VTVERCVDCGFVWASVPDGAITPRVRDGVAALVALLRADVTPSRRPAPDRWSTLEYAAHLRDVLFHVRDRVVIALVEDDPEFKPLYRDQRVDLGLYAADTVPVVAGELETAAALFTRTFDRLDAPQRDRPCRYAFPTLSQRTIRWMGQQVVHEVEHHLGDVRTQVTARA
jgi:hypothetical protein